MDRPSQARLSPTTFRIRLALILVIGLVGVAFTFSPFLKRFLRHAGQDPSYHRFADDQTILGIPNCLNVVSSLPFTVVGLLGLGFLIRGQAKSGSEAFRDVRERWPFVAFFLGMALTGLGSAFYHWAPDNGRLVWDRLPMSIVFTAFLAATIAERVSVKIGIGLLLPLAAAGLGSVLYWDWTERCGAGDLRFYGIVQVYSFVAIALMLLLLPARYTKSQYVWGAIGWFVLAKALDNHTLDRGIYALEQLVSGHTLKHLAGALGAFWLLLTLKLRRPLYGRQGRGETRADAEPAERARSKMMLAAEQAFASSTLGTPAP